VSLPFTVDFQKNEVNLYGEESRQEESKEGVQEERQEGSQT
jgi:hypothetical protein